MDESVNSRDKGNHPIGPRQGQRNRILTNHFDPTPRTAASYKECCIGEQVEQQKKNKKEKNKRTIIHVDSDHDDSDVEECNGLVDDRQDYVHEDSDLFYESSGEEEEPFMKNKTPAIVTPLGKARKATTERNIVHSQSVVTTTDSAASKTANDTDLVDSDDDKFPVVVRRTQRKRICTNRFDPTTRISTSYKDGIEDLHHNAIDEKQDSMSVDSDPESDEESLSLKNKKAPPVGTPATNATGKLNASTSSNDNPQADGGWNGRAYSPGNTQFYSVANVTTNTTTNTIANTTTGLSSTSKLFRNPTSGKSKYVESKFAIRSDELLEVFEENNKDQFILRQIFGERVKIRKVFNMTEPLEKEITRGGKLYNLVATKFEKGSSGANFFNKNTNRYIKAFYIEGKAKGIQKEMEGIANFRDCWNDVGKLASRVELLLTPASKCSSTAQNSYYMFGKQMHVDMFEVREDLHDNQTEGCGFIPCDILCEFLGQGKKAQNAEALQVRVVSPYFGIFKGMLVAKFGIDKIQLPLSMRKIGKLPLGKKKNSTIDDVYLLVNNVCPSDNNQNLERSINPNLTEKPTKTSLQNLKPLSSEVKKLLGQIGVPENVLDDYDDQSMAWEGKRHASLTGVCDCTDKGLPEGHVFIPGVFPLDGSPRKVLLTRSPCTHTNDLATVPVVTERPTGMKEEDWEHLTKFALGVIMFASPRNKRATSLPELINKSDLDGDRFCVIWDQDVLRHAGDLPPGREHHQSASRSENVWSIGNWVEVRPEDGTEYEPAEITRVCGPIVEYEAYDIHYNGGGNEEAVEVGRIRPRELQSEEEERLVEEVVNHNNGLGKNFKVEVKITGQDNMWVSFDHMFDNHTDVLADYAVQEELLDQKDWKWAKNHFRAAKMVSIRNLEVKAGVCQAEALFEGIGYAWVNAKPTNAKEEDIDVGLLAHYLDTTPGHGINLGDTKWRWLKIMIERAEKDWFRRLQDHLAQVSKHHLHNMLIERLNREYKNKNGKHCDQDVRAFGMAYKHSNDISKHGGRVPLPSHLRDTIVQKRKELNDFIQDADDLIGK